MFRIISYLIIVSICISCSNIKGSNNETTSAEIRRDTLKYTYNIYKENSEYVVTDDTDADTTYFKITYPVFDQADLNDSIKKNILLDGENTPSEAAMSFIDGYEEFIEDQNTHFINASWFKDINSQVILNTPILLSLSTQVVEYAGGAHGQHYTIFSNYDTRTNKTFLLKDIIHKDKFKELTKIAEKLFRQQENLNDSVSLSKDFFFEDGIFTLNDNFGLTKNALIIYYNEYEIRPYADGPTKLEISYKYLMELLNNRGYEYIQSIL